jgi:Beta-lactamase
MKFNCDSPSSKKKSIEARPQCHYRWLVLVMDLRRFSVMAYAYHLLPTGPENLKRAWNRSIFWRILICISLWTLLNLISVIGGILLGVLLFRPRQTILAPSAVCPSTLPLDPIQHHPLLPNDTRLASAEKELSSRLQGKLEGTDSAVIIVVHGGQNILEWSYGRIRSNVSEKLDNRKVGPDTIWRVASITKVDTLQ